jgi:DNA repair protein RecN (Recombination protein N)
VSAEFDLSANGSVRAELERLSLDDPDQPQRLLVRRTLSGERSRAFINGTPVNLGQLRALTADLVDVHGQHESQRLALPAVQLQLLDDFGVDGKLRQACAAAFHGWRDALGRLERLRGSVREHEDRASLLTYQLEELETANLEAGEFEQISAEHRRLSQAQDLLAQVQDALAALEDDAALGAAARKLERVNDDHEALLAALDTLRSALALCDDARRDLTSYADTLEHDPQALAEREARLMELHELARKHRVEPEALPDTCAMLRAELDSLSTDRTLLESLGEEVVTLEAGYRRAAKKVSRQRRQAADDFAGAVSQVMNTLGIKGGALSLEFSDTEASHGLENVEFHCVTNPRYPAAPLSRIASGGEQARISLAIQAVAAEKSALPTLVLDEADVGVGGTTADVVGRVLRGLSAHTQVLCVTHAPQVAARGEQHMRVRKTDAQDTLIDPLSEDGRIDELARMLAGADVTDKSREYARNLLREAADNALH